MPFYDGSIGKLLDEYINLGIEEGGRNRPSTDAIAPDANEDRLIAGARRLNLEINQSYREKANKNREKRAILIEEIHSFNQPQEENDILRGLNNAINNEFEINRENATNICMKYLEISAGYKAFRESNKINYPASYPEDKLHHFSIVILFIVIETIINAFFYRNEAGLIGGAVIAFSVSIINMSLAVGCGILYRYKNLSDIKNKIIGYTAIATFILLGISFNLIFATFRISYREEFSKADPDLINAFLIAVKEAFGVFLLTFPRIDFESFILFFLGIIFSVIAFYKGYTSDDKTPGYSLLDKEYKKHEKIYNETIGSIYVRAQLSIDEKRKTLQDMISKLNRIQTDSIAIQIEFREIDRNYKGSLEHLQNDLRHVMTQYRLSNTAIRATQPPKYFSDNIDYFYTVDYVPVDFNDEIGELTNLQNKATRINQDYLPILNNLIHAINDKAYNYLNQTFINFNQQIRQEAEDRINREIQRIM